MFNFLKKKPAEGTETLMFKIEGMHCTSCATNIDLTLEDLPGVDEASTNYQRSLLKLVYRPGVADLRQVKHEVERLGYKLVEMG